MKKCGKRLSDSAIATVNVAAKISQLNHVIVLVETIPLVLGVTGMTLCF